MSSSNEEVHFNLQTETTPKKKSFLQKVGKSRLITTSLFLFLLLILFVFILLFVSKGVDCPTPFPPDHGDLISMETKETQALVDSSSSVWTNLRLPRSLLPSHYNIHLSINLSNFTFTGNTSIHLTASDNVILHDYIILHAIDLDIDGASVSLQQVEPVLQTISLSNCSFHPTNEMYAIKLKDHVIESGNSYVLHFRKFSGVIGDDLKGLYRSSYRTAEGETRYLALTQLQSVDARRVYPCFDEPDMKAVFNVSVTHEEGYTALSNSERRETIEEGKGWVTVHFHPTPLMATYLLAVLVSDFTNESVINDQGLLIRVWTRKDMEKQRSYALETIKKTFEYFSDYFNCTEIMGKSDHAAVPDFEAGAMENWGLVIYRETSMLFDPDSYSFKKTLVSLIMAHEISHSWFGNMATMSWWDDLWLNEGFANTLMFFPVDHFHRDWKMFDHQLVNNIFPVMIRDSLNTSKALSTPIVHLDNITNNFDIISYDKGMAVLRMLRGFLGWDNFRDGLRAYIKEFTFSNANITQILDIFERSSNLTFKIKDIINTWTLQMGFPVVSVSKIGEGRYLLSQQKCQLSSSDTYDLTASPYGYKWIIPFVYVVEGDDEVRTEWMNMTSAEIEVPDDKWLLGNVNCMGMFRVKYDFEMWQRLIGQLKDNHTVFSSASRAALINDAFNLARSDLIPYNIPFDLSTYLKDEDDYAPWKSFCGSLQFVFSMLSDSDSFGKLKKFTINLVGEKFLRMNSSVIVEPTLINLKDLLLAEALRVDMEEAVVWADESFKQWLESQDKMPTSHPNEIFNGGVRMGGERVWDVVWDKTRSSLVAAETEVFYAALAHTQESWLLWRYARRTLNNELIKAQDIGNIYNFFLATPLSRNVLLAFMISNWQEIVQRFSNDAFLMRDLVTTAMRTVNTQYQYQQLLDLYARQPPPSIVAKTFEDSLSLVRSNINWVTHNGASITAWLNKNMT